jgi:16S rRNA (uracil1498-N3)-methyltransferase
MKQIVLPEHWTKDEIVFSGDKFHYLTRVRRIKVGDTLLGIDKTGRRFDISCIALDNSCCVFKMVGSHGKKTEHYTLTLVQCLPKGQKSDQIVRQTVELGIHEFIPVISQHTVFSFKNKTEKKIERWKRIAYEAVQQSGRGDIPVIRDPKQLSSFISEIDISSETTGLFFHNEPLEEKGLHQQLDSDIKKVIIVVGPEGGFSPEEIKLMEEKRFAPVFLGKNTLRSETAAVAAVSAVNLLMMEKPKWNAIV